MIDPKSSYKRLCILLFICIILFSFVFMPYYSNSKLQINLKDYDLTHYIDIYILGLINIDDLAIWVLGVDRRVIVLKMMHEKRFIQASDIADSTQRSLQNISYAMRELEEHGLIRCLTPEKHTWKKYIPTEKGTKVFEKLKKNHLIGE